MLSEVESVSGQAGNFTARVKHHPRYIDPKKCIACGMCAEKCPKKVDDEYNMGIAKRKAAYLKYGQTVPLKYAIDGEACIYLTKGKCRACEKFCPTKAIRFDDTPRTVDYNVGAVILAPGFDTYDPTGMDAWGYGKIPDVVTSMEFERLLSPSGPGLGHITRMSDHKEPKRIAWLQCVGSRGINRAPNSYCSSVCCMYAVKQAVAAKEHLPPEAEQTIFYMDMRCHGKNFDRYMEDAKARGVRMLPVRPHTLEPGRNHIGVVLDYHAIGEKERRREEFDMVVLSVGMEPKGSAVSLAKRMGVELNAHRFAETSGFSPVSTNLQGVFVTGGFGSPMDIPQAVAEASAAASEAAALLAPARGTLAKTKVWPEERAIGDENPRVGVFVCSCGVNIAGVIDVAAVAEYARSLPGVAHVENNLFTCSTDTQDMMAAKIKELGLNRVVVAACTPRTHEPVFQDTLREAGLNPYLVEMANIRNQNSWVHAKDPAKATAKAKEQLRMAVAKAVSNVSVANISVNVVGRALVAGGGLAGLTSALTLADQGFEVVLVETSGELGGHARAMRATWRGEDIAGRVGEMAQQAMDHPRITVCLNSRVAKAEGSAGNFSGVVETPSGPLEVRFGAAVLATGATEHKPSEYLYGKHPKAHTHLEFDKVLEDSASLKGAEAVVFIQCVGSREPARPYCSRVCCTHTVKSSLALKKTDPDMGVYVLYRDIRTYGFREDLYQKAREAGVVFIRYTPEEKPRVREEGGNLLVTVKEPLLGLTLEIAADRLVLASAVIPRANPELFGMFHCGTDPDGFLTEAHPKLRPVDLPSEGLYVAGLAHYPKPVEETVAQAKAAAGRAAVLLSRKILKLSGVIAKHNRDICMSCLACLRFCPYGSPYIAPDGRIAHNEVKCAGCGICAGICPAKAFQVHNYKDSQILAMIDALTEDIGRPGGGTARA